MKLSYSSISLLHDCGLAFVKRYIEKATTGKRGISQVVGTAVDAAVNADLSEKMRTGSLLPLGDIVEIAIGRVKEQFALSDVSIPDTANGWMTGRHGAINAAVDMAECHHKNVAPEIKPIAIQRYWELNRNGVELNGYIDIQESDAVRDTKTSYKPPYASTVEESKQLTMYAMAVKELDGTAPSKVYLDYLIKPPFRGDVKSSMLWATRSPEDFVQLDSWISAADSTIKSGDFRPAKPGHWMCCKNWCDYWNGCPYGSGGKHAYR